MGARDRKPGVRAEPRPPDAEAVGPTAAIAAKTEGDPLLAVPDGAPGIGKTIETCFSRSPGNGPSSGTGPPVVCRIRRRAVGTCADAGCHQDRTGSSYRIWCQRTTGVHLTIVSHCLPRPRSRPMRGYQKLEGGGLDSDVRTGVCPLCPLPSGGGAGRRNNWMWLGWQRAGERSDRRHDDCGPAVTV